MNKTRNLLSVLSIALLATAVVFLASPGRSAMAAIDRLPNNTTGAIYKTTPSQKNDGEYDSLHIDQYANLLVSIANPASFSPGPSATNPTPFTTTSSNGVTAVTLVSATASKVIVTYYLAITNTDSVGHTINVLTSSGTVIDYTFLSPSAVYTYEGNAAGFSQRTLSGEGLQFVLPNFVAEGGTGTTCKAIGYTTKQ